MATVFQRKGSKVWIAALRVWSAEKGRFVWVQKPTGTRDKAQAAGIAAMLEQASGSTKAGTMTREKALALVNDILRLAGAESVTPCPSLQNVADELLEAVEVSPGSLRRYEAHWSAKSTIPARISRPTNGPPHPLCCAPTADKSSA